MYNKSFKEKYIASKNYTNPARIRTLTNTLESIGDVETLLGKDLGLFTVSEIYLLSSYLTTRTATATRDRLAMVESYLRYYWEYNGVSEDVVKQYMFYFNFRDISSNENLKSTMVGSGKYMEDILDMVLPPVDERRTTNLSRATAWLLFMGVPKEKIMSIKKSDVDFDKNELVVDDRRYKLDDNAIPVLHSLCTGSYFVVTRREREMTVSVKDPDILLSNYRERNGDPTLTLAWYITGINKRCEESGLSFAYSVDRIATSGRFYRLYLMEKHGVPIEDEVREYLVQKGFSGVSLQTKLRFEVTNYKNWKDTFHSEGGNI